jgi:hypothetical protein
MGNTLCPERILRAFHAPCFLIEEPQVVVHEAHQPDLLGNLLDADLLASEHVTQVDLAPRDADASAGGHGNRAIVERIFQITQARNRHEQRPDTAGPRRPFEFIICGSIRGLLLWG